MKQTSLFSFVFLTFLLVACAPTQPTLPIPQVDPKPLPVPSPQPIVEEIVEEAPPPTPPPLPAEEVQPQASSTLKEFDVIVKRWEYNPSVITVNKGDTVILHLKTVDVAHGFSLPEFGVRTKIPADKEVMVEFVADTKGEFNFRCNVFCGSGHGNHRGKLVVQ